MAAMRGRLLTIRSIITAHSLGARTATGWPTCGSTPPSPPRRPRFGWSASTPPANPARDRPARAAWWRATSQNGCRDRASDQRTTYLDEPPRPRLHPAGGRWRPAVAVRSARLHRHYQLLVV